MSKHKTQISTFLTKNAKKISIPLITSMKSNKFVSEPLQKTIKLLPKLKKTKEIQQYLTPLISNTQKAQQSSFNILSNNESIEQNKFIIRKNEPKIIKNSIIPYVINSKSNKSQQITPKPQSNFVNSALNMIAFDKNDNTKVKNTQKYQSIKPNLNTKQVLPILFDSKNKKIQEKVLQTKTNSIKQSNNKIESNKIEPTKIKATFSPKSIFAGGKDGAKVVVLNTTNQTSPKEAALVGEAGPEKIIHSSGTVLPLNNTLKAKNTPDAFKFVNNFSKNINSKFEITNKKQIKTSKQVLPFVSNSNEKLKDILITTGKPSIRINKTFSVNSFDQSKEVEPPIQIYRSYNNTIGETPIEMTQEEKENILHLAENKKINNKVEKLPNGRIVVKLPAYAEGKNTSPVAAAASGLAGGIGKMASAAFKASPIGMAASAISSFFGGGEKEEDETDKKAIASQGNVVTPTNITNISYQYDIYRKTADDSFMLPNFRREYG